MKDKTMAGRPVETKTVPVLNDPEAPDVLPGGDDDSGKEPIPPAPAAVVHSGALKALGRNSTFASRRDTTRKVS